MGCCLSLLSNRYIPIELMVEELLVSLDDGRLRVREVYDIFFKLTSPWKDARILAVSPQKLHKEGGLKVQVSVTPGAGGPDDVFYREMVLYGASFDPTTQTFGVTLPAHSGPFDTSVAEYAAKVLEPTLNIPRQIAEVSAATQVMDEFGTIFELDCHDLEPGRLYVIRLIAEPLELLTLPERRPLDVPDIDEVVSRWIQDAAIICSRTSHFNFVRLALGTRDRLDSHGKNCTIPKDELQSAIDGVNRLLAVVNNANLRLMPIRRHQIVLILPRGAELAARSCDGYVWFAESCVLRDGRVAAVWEAGSKQYWRDDPESIAEYLYGYFQKYASVPSCGKKKEEASEAIDAPHDNCSLIVDALCQEGALLDVGGGKYIVVQKSPEEIAAICQVVAACEKVHTGFKWKGYQVRYSVQYRYLSPQDREILNHIRRQRNLGYWLGILGAVLGTISILLSIVSLVVAAVQ